MSKSKNIPLAKTENAIQSPLQTQGFHQWIVNAFQQALSRVLLPSPSSGKHPDVIKSSARLQSYIAVEEQWQHLDRSAHAQTPKHILDREQSRLAPISLTHETFKLSNQRSHTWEQTLFHEYDKELLKDTIREIIPTPQARSYPALPVEEESLRDIAEASYAEPSMVICQAPPDQDINMSRYGKISALSHHQSRSGRQEAKNWKDPRTWMCKNPVLFREGEIQFLMAHLIYGGF